MDAASGWASGEAVSVVGFPLISLPVMRGLGKGGGGGGGKQRKGLISGPIGEELRISGNRLFPFFLFPFPIPLPLPPSTVSPLPPPTLSPSSSPSATPTPSPVTVIPFEVILGRGLASSAVGVTLNKSAPRPFGRTGVDNSASEYHLVSASE